MEDSKFDEFLNEATWAVRDKWESAQGEELSTNETYALNDLLTAFFQDKREVQVEQN